MLIQIFFPLLAFGQNSYLPDTSINGVSLMDWKSFEKKFSSYQLPDYVEEVDAPKLEFINSNKTQKLIVSHCYASHKDEICRFRIEYRRKNDSIPRFGTVIKDKYYKTDKGIYLGMSLEEFKKKIGIKNYKSSYTKGKLKIIITLEDFNKNPFLQQYNMPKYSGEYYFKNDQLILFKFGFPNP